MSNAAMDHLDRIGREDLENVNKLEVKASEEQDIDTKVKWIPSAGYLTDSENYEDMTPINIYRSKDLRLREMFD